MLKKCSHIWHRIVVKDNPIFLIFLNLWQSLIPITKHKQNMYKCKYDHNKLLTIFVFWTKLTVLKLSQSNCNIIIDWWPWRTSCVLYVNIYQNKPKLPKRTQIAWICTKYLPLDVMQPTINNKEHSHSLFPFLKWEDINVYTLYAKWSDSSHGSLDQVRTNKFTYGLSANIHSPTCFPIQLITSYYVMYIAEYCNVMLN